MTLICSRRVSVEIPFYKYSTPTGTTMYWDCNPTIYRPSTGLSNTQYPRRKKTHYHTTSLLTNAKDERRNRQGAVYKINCFDCHASYIGETGKNLTTRLTEHRRGTRKGDVNNHIAEHHRPTNHTVDWDSVQCLTYSTNYFRRLPL